MSYTFHLLGLSHLPASKEYISCAFTAKNIKLARMLCSLGHTIHMYGAKTINPKYNVEEYVNSDNFHFVETHTVDDIADSWGEGDNRFEIKYAWPEKEYKHDFNRPPAEVTKKFYANAIEHINKIKKPDDFVLCTQGTYHATIANAVKLFLNCESGIGYRGSNQGWFRCFESAFIQSFLYGSEKPFASQDGRNYDCVIPNYFDPDDIEFSADKEDYFLFMARLIRRKGIVEAYKSCKEAGVKLVIAGQCGKITPDGHLVSVYPNEYDIPPDSNWEFVGFQNVEQRKKLMAHAKGTLILTTYLEAFGGVHCESMLSGTPIVVSSWGVFGDGNTFVPGIHGFRYNSLDDLVFAIKNCHKLDPYEIRKNGERFLMDNVKWQYQKWFEDLHFLWESTQDKNAKGWHRIREEEPEWRKRLYPQLFKK